MKNFVFYNPTRIIFGKGTIAKIDQQISPTARVLMCYGGGSIKGNTVYDQVITALKDRKVHEFGGIETNPDYDTLMEAIVLGRDKRVDFILAVGGGSVIDGAKLVAAGIPYEGDNLWDIVTGEARVRVGKALPLGTVLTLPATSSEMNNISVISRRATKEKFGWMSDAVYPAFSVLDPTVTYSLPEEQVRNGIVDTYIHVMEQYATVPVNALLQERQAEAILLTLQDISQKVLEMPPDYGARANLMWTASNGLNNFISCGVPGDWATHGIGHELTALYGLAHAESLAVVLPHLLWHQREKKAEKLAQYAQRVWGLTGGGDELIREALDRMCDFFRLVKMPTRLTDFQIDPQEAANQVRQRFDARGSLLGEHGDITPDQVAEILLMSQ